MIVPQCRIRFGSTGIECFLRGIRGDQAIAAANQILPPRFDEGIAHFEEIFRFEKLHQCPLHLAIRQPACHFDGLLREWIDARVKHARGDVERCGDEILHLIGSISRPLQIECEIDHLGERAAGMSGNEVRHELLLRFPSIGTGLFVLIGKLIEICDARLRLYNSAAVEKLRRAAIVSRGDDKP